MTITDTGNNSIDALLSGDSWLSGPAAAGGAPTVITYSFMTANTDGAKGFLAMNSTQQQAAATALATWASVANIQFKQVASGGEIQFGTADLGSAASGETDWNYNSNGLFTTNYIYLNNTGNYRDQQGSAYNLVFTPGSYAPSVLIHEIGHALGLKHPGNYDGTPPPYLLPSYDNRDYSVMSYNDGDATTTYFQQFSGLTYSVTPMSFDIQAIQYLYGANSASGAGDSTYRFSNFSAPQAVWDASGSNSFDFSACTGKVTINLYPGGISSTYLGSENIGIAYGTAIDTAIAGSGGSYIFCNTDHDTIIGGVGNDTIMLSTGTATIDGKGGYNVVAMGPSSSTLDGDSFTDIQALDIGQVNVAKLTIAQYNYFSAFLNSAGGIHFADAGSITTNPTVQNYYLTNGNNTLTFTQPSQGNYQSYLVYGAALGSDLYDIRGGTIDSHPQSGFTYPQLAVWGQGAQDTLELSGSAGDYVIYNSNHLTGYIPGTVMEVQDTVAGRDGLVSLNSIQALEFTDLTVATNDPVLTFVAGQNDLRYGSSAANFHFGVAGTTSNNAIGEESANLGSGYNAVVLNGPESQYGLSVNSAGTLTLTDNSTHQTYTITGDHYLVFDKGAFLGYTNSYQEIDFVLQGTDAEIAAVYNAALGRQPDLPGLEFYSAQITQGTLSLHQAADYFFNSPEFQRLFPSAAKPSDDGGSNDQAFISSLYQNILHRTPSASETAFYVADLQGTLPGVPQQDRGQLLLYFALGSENQKAISGWLI